jgi:AraC-like DNA-binding protein
VQVTDVLRSLAISAIAALAIGGSAEWEERRLRLAATRYIKARYADPVLSSSTIAAHLGLSRRSLQRLFEGEEKTIAQYIHEVRTRHALARLGDPRLALVPLSEIATLSGFGSVVAMRRAVQEATGVTPTEVRRNAISALNANIDDNTAEPLLVEVEAVA